MTADDVAAWMLAEVMRDGLVYQQSIAGDIESKFGEEFVPTNGNGHMSIRKDVLAAFRKISENSVVWSKYDKAWRKRESSDDPGRQQA
jgi:hypothetical protein